MCKIHFIILSMGLIINGLTRGKSLKRKTWNATNSLNIKQQIEAQSDISWIQWNEWKIKATITNP